jgi:cytochrome c oxidase subunit 4
MSDHATHADKHGHCSDGTSDCCHGHAAEKHGIAHVMPMPILFGVFFALIALTALTVASHSFDFAALNIWVAMGIATVKALLVAVFFMHLRYDKPLNAIVIGSSFIFVFLFIGILLIDSHNYKDDIDRYQNYKKYAPESSPTTNVPQGAGAIQATPAAAPAVPVAPAIQ